MINANNEPKRKHLYHKQKQPRAIWHNKKLRELFKVPQFKYVYKKDYFAYATLLVSRITVIFT